MIAYRQKTVDLTPIGGAKVAQVLEGVVQEIDLGTGAVRFEWNSLDHVPVTESYAERPPAVVGRRVAGGVTTVFASWNGATEVVTWRVLAGPAADQLKPVADAAKTGFETATAATTGRPTSPWRRWTPVGPCSGRPIQSR
nr:arylsulfotransferase family protein [Herbihabitans rhizosphaerae]